VLTSDTRILTTHAGSLPRPAALADLHGRRSRGDDVDPTELQQAIEGATTSVIAKQVAAGIDIGNDGEQARESFFTYVQHRMTGFGGTSQRPLMRDLLDHPDFVELALPRFQRIKVSLMSAPAAIGEVTYRDTSELDAECALVADAPFAQTFMTACSPGIVASAMENRHYASREAYVRAVADALRTEYLAIVDRGLLLQIDAPDLALERHTLFADRPLAEFLEWVELVIDAINGALTGIDPANVRLHVCWGNYEGPHTLDVALEAIQPLLYEANVGALVISPCPRGPLLRADPAPRRHGARRRCDRHDEQLRRAPRGGRRSHRPRGGGRRRPDEGHRRHGLRLRHLGGDRRRRPLPGVGEAASSPRRRRSGVSPPVLSVSRRRGP
jgi:5-methyltetrahydropteroyltriglutamate--homocysteine methyltransferase